MMPGPQPKVFLKWMRAMGKGRLLKKLRVFVDDTEKLVAFKSAPITAQLIERMGASKVEALDAEGTLLGVWDFPEEDVPQEPIPGYTKDPGDDPEERLLKTFAHLLADAHRQASKQLVEVVGIQAQHFAEERRNAMTLRIQNEKLMAALARKISRGRVRIATGEDGEEVEEAESETKDSFMEEFLSPLIAKYMQSQVTNGAPAPAAAKEGA